MGLDLLGRELFGTPILENFSASSDEHARAARQLKQFLLDQDYTDRAICSRMSVASLQSVPPHRNEILCRWVLGDGPLDELIRLFLLNVRFEPERLQRLLPPPLADFLAKVGMLARTREGQVLATVSIFPHAALHLVTDAWTYGAVWGAAERHADRVMYPGHDSTGLAYIASRAPSARTLDLCCGSGIQALLAAEYSREVVAVDINPRAVRMAEFNARMNGIENVTFLTGDLYGPVEGQTFDAVLANPPFVPKPSGVVPQLLFRDGGPAGEAVLARILSGWRRHANEGARLAIVSDLINLANYAPKLRVWQGDHPETHLFLEEETDLVEYALNHSGYVTDQDDRQRATLDMLDALEEAGVRTVHFGYLIQGSTRPGPLHVHGMNAIVSCPSQLEAARIVRTREVLAADRLTSAILQLEEDVEVTVSLIGKERRIRLDASRSLAGVSCEVSCEAYALLDRISSGPTLFGELTPDEQALACELARLNVLHLA